jgi:flagellin-like protein
MKKRGLSPVIASVLLIALVLVLAAIIFLWARGFISEQIEKFGKPIEELCGDVSFDLELVDATGGYDLEVVNRGNVPIYNFDIKEIKGGNSDIQKFKFSVNVGKSVRQAISLKADTEKIVVYPVIVGNVKGKKVNKPFTCSEIGKTIVL